MNGGTYQDRPMPIRATRLRAGCLALPLLLLLTGVGFGYWYFWGKPKTLAQQAALNGQDSAPWPSWLKQQIAYTPEPLPKHAPTPPPPDPHAETLKAILAQLEAQQREIAALKRKPPETQGAPKPRKHAPMLFITHELEDDDKGGPDLYTLAPGAGKISCQVETEMNSDVQGVFTAKVTAPIYDTATGQHLLVPQNSTVLGRYSSESLLYGNERLPTFSLLLTLPNGKTVDVGEAPVTDNLGVAGLTGDVDHHFWRNLAAVLITGTLRGGAQAVQTRAVTGGVAGQIGSGMAGATSQHGQQVASQAIDVRPTIRIPAGQGCVVILTKALELPEYN